MSGIRENALTILRVMHEAELGLSTGLSYREVLHLSRLSEQAFDKAVGYLLSSKYLDGTQGGMDGTCWLTVNGIDYVERELASRYPLSLDAERILRYAVGQIGQQQLLANTIITNQLELDRERYAVAIHQLGNLSFVQDLYERGGYEVIKVTQEGKAAVQHSFRMPVPNVAPNYTYNTTFDQRGQAVTYQYNAAGDINIGAVQNRVELFDQLEKLRDELTKAADAKVIDAEVVSDARYQVEKAVIQAKKPEPDKKTIVDRLNEAKGLLQGIAAAAGMVEALAKAAELVQTLF